MPAGLFWLAGALVSLSRRGITLVDGPIAQPHAQTPVFPSEQRFTHLYFALIVCRSGRPDVHRALPTTLDQV